MLKTIQTDSYGDWIDQKVKKLLKKGSQWKTFLFRVRIERVYVGTSGQLGSRWLGRSRILQAARVRFFKRIFFFFSHLFYFLLLSFFFLFLGNQLQRSAASWPPRGRTTKKSTDQNNWSGRWEKTLHVDHLYNLFSFCSIIFVFSSFQKVFIRRWFFSFP